MADGTTIAEPARAARAAGLVYVTDDMPGITRRRRGRGFSFHLGDTLIRDADQITRIKALAVPPAYSDVWISPLANGHLQATGRDEKGRKQYRYHDRYRALQEEAKFDRLSDMGAALPVLRQRVDADLRRRNLSREKVLATAVRMLERTLIRVGNREYTRTNNSVGLTTLSKPQVDITADRLRLVFRGKGGKPYRLKLRDRRVANTLRRLEEIDGQHLFQWLDEDGKARDITSTDVNDYLRETTGADITAKYFRTWGATVLMARALNALPPDFQTEAEGNRNVLAAVDEVAAILGNTRTVCRNSYIHPKLPDLYMSGSLKGRIRDPDPKGLPFAESGLSPVEKSVLKLISDG